MSRYYFYRSYLINNQGETHWFVQQNDSMELAKDHARTVANMYPQYGAVYKVERVSYAKAKNALESKEIFHKTKIS